MDVWRIRLVIVGGLLASGGIAVLVKEINHQMNGVAASAKVLDLKSECYIARLQASENKWSHEPIDCKAEPELKQAFGSDKHVEVMRQDTATIEFPLRDGSAFKTEVGQQPYTRSHELHVGDTVPVVYDPQSPRDARAPLGLLDVLVSLAIFGFGAGSVLFAFKFNLRRKSGFGPDVKLASVSGRASNPPPLREARVNHAADDASRPSRSSFGRR